MKKIVTPLLTAAIGLAGFTQSIAGTSPGTIEVTATVESYCNIVTTPVAFGKYDPVSTETTIGEGSVSLACTKGTKPSAIRLDYGKNSAGTEARAMSTDSGSDLLKYELYKPITGGGKCSNANSEIWGNTAITGLTIAEIPNVVTPNSFSVCGKIAARQLVQPGSYKDTITVTVDF